MANRLIQTKFRLVKKKEHSVECDRLVWYKEYFDNPDYTIETFYSDSVTVVMYRGEIIAYREGTNYFVVDRYDRVSLQGA